RTHFVRTVRVRGCASRVLGYSRGSTGESTMTCLHREYRDRVIRSGLWTIVAALMLVLSGPAFSETPFNKDKPFAEHFLVLQISDSEPAKQAAVLSVAANLIEYYGPDMVDIEVVAFGPGISLVFADNDNVDLV